MLFSFDIAGSALTSFYSGFMQTWTTLELIVLYEVWSANQTNESGRIKLSNVLLASAWAACSEGNILTQEGGSKKMEKLTVKKSFTEVASH
jgi:hypothetical protein